MLVLRRLAIVALLVQSVLFALGSPVLAQDEEPNLEFFYPVVTRRPIIERELEFKMQAAKSKEGSEYTFTGALEYPIFPWWQVELEVPIVSAQPSDSSSQTGFGDLTLENKFRPWESVEHRAQVSAGFELTLPSGSRARRGNDPALRGRTQVYLTPGFNVRPLPGVTLRAGVQLPVTGANEFDWTVHGGIVWEF